MVSDRSEALDTGPQDFLQLTAPAGLDVQMETELSLLPPCTQAE